jgi:serine phosphatase RsbU (regulator of sigma subunit)
MLARLAPGPAAGLLDAVGGAVREHVGDAERYDDLTMLAVRRLP